MDFLLILNSAFFAKLLQFNKSISRHLQMNVQIRPKSKYSVLNGRSRLLVRGGNGSDQIAVINRIWFHHSGHKDNVTVGHIMRRHPNQGNSLLELSVRVSDGWTGQRVSTLHLRLRWIEQISVGFLFFSYSN